MAKFNLLYLSFVLTNLGVTAAQAQTNDCGPLKIIAEISLFTNDDLVLGAAYGDEGIDLDLDADALNELGSFDAQNGRSLAHQLEVNLSGRACPVVIRGLSAYSPEGDRESLRYSGERVFSSRSYGQAIEISSLRFFYSILLQSQARCRLQVIARVAEPLENRTHPLPNPGWDCDQ